MAKKVKYTKAQIEQVVDHLDKAKTEVASQLGVESNAYVQLDSIGRILRTQSETVDPEIVSGALQMLGAVTAALILALGGSDSGNVENLNQLNDTVNQVIIHGDVNVEGDLTIDAGEFPETSDQDFVQQFEDALEDDDSPPAPDVFTPDSSTEPPQDDASAHSMTLPKIESTSDLFPPTVSQSPPATQQGSATIDGSSSVSASGRVVEGTASGEATEEASPEPGIGPDHPISDVNPGGRGSYYEPGQFGEFDTVGAIQIREGSTVRDLNWTDFDVIKRQFTKEQFAHIASEGEGRLTITDPTTGKEFSIAKSLARRLLELWD